jgi:nicotinate-nucleotide--dimethylbenzimidazole phosphoribosyltransferase
MADRERLRQAAKLDPNSGRRLLDLQLEGIREAPLGVVVCCDRRVPAAGVLGRATFPDADLWSCACAIQNLWLAARAEGLGVGWVTFFDPAKLAALVHIPQGVETLGWLCLGWPDERPPTPGLERAGWSRRMPLSDVVLRERWPEPDEKSEPAAPPSHLRAPNQKATVAVRDETDRLLSPPSSLGALDRTLDRVLALGRRDLTGGALLCVAADHPVTAYGVSAYSPAVTAEVLRAAVAGQSMGAAAARSAGLRVVVVDAGVDTPLISGAIDARPRDARGDLVQAEALTLKDTHHLMALGRDLGLGLAREGLVALGEVGVGNTTVAATLAAVLLGCDAEQTVGLGAGADTDMLHRKVDVVNSAARRARTIHGERLDDPVMMLAAVGGGELAVLAGAVLGAASNGGVIILDGLATSLAALVAVRLQPAVAAHLVAAHRSREVAHPLVLDELGLEPLLDLRMRAGEGVAACLVVPLLRAALATRHTTATTQPPNR